MANLVAIIWIPAFAGMTEVEEREIGSAGWDSDLISGSELGCERLDSRFRGNDGGRRKGEGIRWLVFGLDFGWRTWLQSSGFPLSRE